MIGSIILGLIVGLALYFVLAGRMNQTRAIIGATIGALLVMVVKPSMIFDALLWTYQQLANLFAGQSDKIMMILVAVGVYFLIRGIRKHSGPTWEKVLMISLVVDVALIAMTVAARGLIPSSMFRNLLLWTNVAFLAFSVVFYWRSALQQPLANALSFFILIYLLWALGCIYFGWGIWWSILTQYDTVQFSMIAFLIALFMLHVVWSQGIPFNRTKSYRYFLRPMYIILAFLMVYVLVLMGTGRLHPREVDMVSLKNSALFQIFDIEVNEALAEAEIDTGVLLEDAEDYVLSGKADKDELKEAVAVADASLKRIRQETKKPELDSAISMPKSLKNFWQGLSGKVKTGETYTFTLIATKVGWHRVKTVNGDIYFAINDGDPDQGNGFWWRENHGKITVSVTPKASGGFYIEAYGRVNFSNNDLRHNIWFSPASIVGGGGSPRHISPGIKRCLIVKVGQTHRGYAGPGDYYF